MRRITSFYVGAVSSPSVGQFGDIGLRGWFFDEASALSLQGIGDHQMV
jgi:hypothetical protein